MGDVQDAVTGHLIEWFARRGPDRILVYEAMARELAVGPACDRAHGPRFVITRTPDRGWLTVHDRASERELHRYGFSQPVAGAEQVPRRAIDAAIVPGLAFDLRGVRLGHGMGYYDELLAGLRPGIPLVGVAAGALVVPRLPDEPHDVRMTSLLTEDGVVPVRPEP